MQTQAEASSGCEYLIEMQIMGKLKGLVVAGSVLLSSTKPLLQSAGPLAMQCSELQIRTVALS